MQNLFDFFLDDGDDPMADIEDMFRETPYEERVVDHYESGGLIVDTASVPDGVKPYETAVEHSDYRRGGWVIVDSYATKEEALVGHQKWVQIMTTEPLPDQLVDVHNSTVEHDLAEKYISDKKIPDDMTYFPRKKSKQK